MAKMDKRVKKLWIEALKSGEYRQQKENCLRQDNRFCCLGVLCDLHAKETGGSWTYGRYFDQLAFLPEEVKEWAELLSDNPQLGERSSISCNDGDGENGDDSKDFEQIANLIQRYL